MLRYEKYAFYFLVLLALSIVVVPRFYITGDGPSHTYNAKILFDYLLNHDRDFYKEFFIVNRSLDPNWIGHLIIGFFLQVMPYWLADKSFQVLYLLSFAFGFRYLIRSIHSENTFLSFLFFPFLFTLPFQQGFYNYSLALACMCWTIGYYIRIRHQLEQATPQLILSGLLVITALCHAMPLMYAIMIIILIWLSEHLHLLIPFDLRKISAHFSRLCLIFMPSALLVLLFLLKRGTGREPHSLNAVEKLLNFLAMYASQSTRSAERYPAIACGLLLIVFLVVLLFTRMKVNIPKKINLGFVFLIMMAFTFVAYLTCPHSIGGAGSIDIRLAFLPPFFMLLFFATKRWSQLSKLIFLSISILISVVFLMIRFPYVMKANRIGKEIMQAGRFIEKRHVVLNLHFDYWQKLTANDSLFHHDGSFLHFSDYLGAMADKPLVLLNNYEAEINYFPINWQPGKNPRESISGFIQGTLPPCGDYRLYEQQVKRPIDYILFQNWRRDALQSTCVGSMIDQINKDFVKVFESKQQSVILFKRRS